MNFIKHIIEPEKLLLTWRSPDKDVRTRFIVAELRKKEATVCFRYLENTSDFKGAQEAGFDMYPAYPPKKISNDVCEGVIDTFMRRLPPRKRGDFNLYLRNFRLPENVQISDFALLGYTGAKLPTDGFEVSNPFSNATGDFEFLMEAAGFRHINEVDVNELDVDSEVTFDLEPNNKFDSNAIAIRFKKKKLGYVPRTLTGSVKNWLMRKIIVAKVEKFDVRKDSPILYLFVEIKTG